jgi:hypothetical protein
LSANPSVNQSVRIVIGDQAFQTQSTMTVKAPFGGQWSAMFVACSAVIQELPSRVVGPTRRRPVPIRRDVKTIRCGRPCWQTGREWGAWTNMEPGEAGSGVSNCLDRPHPPNTLSLPWSVHRTGHATRRGSFLSCSLRWTAEATARPPCSDI